MEDGRAGNLEEDDPDDEMKRNFPPAWRLVIRAKTDEAINEEEQWQRDRHCQRVIEMTMEKRRVVVEIWFDNEPIQDVESQSHHKERVLPVPESAMAVSWHT